ncbi:MAG: ATP-binding protein, partial [Halobacteriovoraceae bacterium]|nr:ATP-binding protein [Halobacteriovoraceae bacterium]
LQIIPKKWIQIFGLKYLMVQNKFKGGKTKISSVIPELLGILLFLFLPFLVVRANHSLVEWMESVRNSLSNPYQFTPIRQKIAVLLQRVGPFIPLILTITALNIFRSVIKQTILSELALLIPFILYYLYYRLFRQLTINFLIIFSEFARLGKSREAKVKIFSSTKILGRFFLLALLTLHLVSSVAGKGLLYEEMYYLSIVLGVFHYLWLVKTWSSEIDGYMEKILVSSILGAYKKLIELPIISFITRTLSFLLILIHPLYGVLKRRVLNIGIGKTIIAKVFQRKLESSEDLTEISDASLPQEYSDWFSAEKDDDENLWIQSKNQRLGEIQVELDEWLQDTSEEHSLAIYGDKGIGKTQVLRHLEEYLNKHEKKPEVLIAGIPPKLSSKAEVLKFLGQLVAGKELTDVYELLDIDKEIGKKVIILDDAQNLFLTHFGGLKAIEAFFETLNVRTDNIFWVASFSTYSWIYLNQVFHKNKYFRTVFKIKGFSDEELQDYIIRRHDRSGFSLSYADIIRAVDTKHGGTEVSYVENMFFRLLWDQSHGNPELAEKLWLKALKPLYGKRLKVGLPLTKSYPILHKLADESLFVLSALMRHENLTTPEIIQVTDMKEGVVRHALRIGLENDFLIRNDGDKRYRFSVEGQYSVLNLLKAKNFIYE